MLSSSSNPLLNLGQRIKNYRNRAHESQEDFGARFGVKRLAVQGWERGAVPNGKHLTKILELLDAADEAPSVQQDYQLELPFSDPIDFALKITPSALQTIHLHLTAKTKTS